MFALPTGTWYRTFFDAHRTSFDAHLPARRTRRRKWRSMFCVQAVIVPMSSTHKNHAYSSKLQWNFESFSSIVKSIMSFTEKVSLKSLRFTELSHETEVLNMVTEIMGLSSQIPKPTKPYAGEVVYSSQQEECVCVQHISHPVQWCSQK